MRCDLFWIGVRKLIDELGEGATTKQKMVSLKKWCGKEDRMLRRIIEHLEFCDQNKLTYEGPRKINVPIAPEGVLRPVREMKDKKLQKKIISQLRKQVKNNKSLTPKNVQDAVVVAAMEKKAEEEPCDTCVVAEEPKHHKALPASGKCGRIRGSTGKMTYYLLYRVEPHRIVLQRETSTGFVEGPFDIPRDTAPELLKILREWLNENKK